MSTTTQSAPADRLAFADGLRAIAVLWVVVYHLLKGEHITRLAVHMPGWLLMLMEHGYLGVTIFFVLSGYVMALTTHSFDVDGGVARRFLLRRLIRLTPPLYVSIAVGVALAWAEAVLRPQTAQVPSLGSVLAHLFYAQELLGLRPINDVYWTLVVEIQFYVAFALMAWGGDALRRATGWRSARMVVVALVMLVSAPWALRLAVTALWPGGFIGFWYSFMLGVLVCWWSRREAWAGAGLAVMMLTVAVGVLIDPQANGVVSLLTAAALGLAHRLGAMQRWLNLRWLQWVGLISYSVYLFHTNVQGTLGFVIRKVVAPSVAADVLSLLVLVIGPLLVSWLAYRLIEVPSIAWSRRVRMRPAPATATLGG